MEFKKIENRMNNGWKLVEFKELVFRFQNNTTMLYK